VVHKFMGALSVQNTDKDSDGLNPAFWLSGLNRRLLGPTKCAGWTNSPSTKDGRAVLAQFPTGGTP